MTTEPATEVGGSERDTADLLERMHHQLNKTLCGGGGGNVGGGEAVDGGCALLKT